MSSREFDVSTRVESYAETHLVPPEPGFTHAHENTVYSDIALTPTQGKFFSLLSTISGARNVLELGTLGGYSSLWFAKSLRERQGKITTIELDSSRHRVAVQNIRSAGVKVPEEVEAINGAALDILPKLEAEIEKGNRERFDFVFIDADWGNMSRYFDYGVRLSKGKGSVICVDNVGQSLVYSGAMRTGRKSKTGDSLVEMVGEDSRVDAVLSQTMGNKGLDGFLMAIVK